MANVKIPVANRFVPAKHDDWGNRKGPALGFVLHMAEGNNVWRYLSTGNVARNVSVHFTVEADGEIVQMMNLNRISGSINPGTLRTTDDPNGNYGYSDARYALKSWWSNPNNAVITVEVAGRQKDGPNDKQVASIKRLFDYLKGRYPQLIPLGHRDFQSVKPCPGQKFYHAVYKVLGGHGKDYREPSDGAAGGGSTSTFDEDSMIYVTGTEVSSTATVRIPKGTKAYMSPSDTKPAIVAYNDADREYYGRGRGKNYGWMAVKFRTQQSFEDNKTRTVIAWVPNASDYQVKPVPPVVDVNDQQFRDAISKIATAQAAVDKAVDEASAL